MLRGYYDDQALPFDRWFTNQIKEHHREDIGAYVTAARAHQTRVDALFGG